jgi:hypothetical protein
MSPPRQSWSLGPAAEYASLDSSPGYRSPAKIIAGASGCMDLSRTRVLLALAAATFRVGLIMERGLMRQGITWLWLRRPAALGWRWR